MEPGKRYRGWGYINEFKEFVFEPENTGSRAGVIKHVTQRDGVSVSHTRDFILLHIKLEKCNDVTKYMKLVWNKFSTIIDILKSYEI